MKLRRPGWRGRPLFTTHEPPYRDPRLALGSLVDHDGRFYQITDRVELPPVPLERGGSVGEWEIWGRKVSERRLRREVLGAAEEILDKETTSEERAQRLPETGGGVDGMAVR